MKNFNYVTFNQDEKYLFISFLRVLGVDFHVSGYYEGYYIGFTCDENQEKEINRFLRLFEDHYTFTRELISEGAILRDHMEVTYICRLHEMITDIADSLYNVGLRIVDDMRNDYKAIYNFLGADYFAGVMDDMRSLDFQIYNDSKVEELAASYYDRKVGASK